MREGSPIVNEVRERAMRISNRYGHDPRAYFKHLKDLENKEKSHVVSQITVVEVARKVTVHGAG
jgi:hypothetical protein